MKVPLIITVIIVLVCLCANFGIAYKTRLDIGTHLGIAKRTSGPSGDSIILESGDYGLLETGSYILLE